MSKSDIPQPSQGLAQQPDNRSQYIEGNPQQPDCPLSRESAPIATDGQPAKARTFAKSPRFKMNVAARGAAVIAVGGLISKIIGAVYRIPLTRTIGPEGIGLYQTVFPVYLALLTLSSTGIPAALSALIAGKEEGRAMGMLCRSLLLFGGIGLACSVIMCVLGGFLARLQGCPEAGTVYAALSPSVFAVAVISCIRGYFQSKGNMYPTAVSQIVEQVVKAAFGLLMCARFAHDTPLAACMAALAVTVSEAAAVLYLYIRLKFDGFSATRPSGSAADILKTTFPVALASLFLPLGHLADSFIVINVMNGYADNAAAIYGVYSGSVAAITGVPIALAYGAAVSVIPALKTGESDAKIADSLRFTGFIAVPSAVFLAVFSPRVINFLYSGMNTALAKTAAAVLVLDSLSVVLLSYLQTVNAVLIARGKQKIAVISAFSALAVRAALCALFTSDPKTGVLGAVIAADISYAVALAVNARFALSPRVAAASATDLSLFAICGILCVLGGFAVCRVISGRAWFVFSSLLCAGCYVAAVPLAERLLCREGERAVLGRTSAGKG